MKNYIMKLWSYKNGNADITIYKDGTRIIESSEELSLEFPLNIDIRVSNKCSFGKKPDGHFVLCSFCHEDARTDGSECNYELLKSKLKGLPKGLELAIGSNNLTEDLMDFLYWSTNEGYINNLTINQGHLKRDMFNLLECIETGIVKGLGISYRKDIKWNVPIELLEYENTVFHTIIGIDSIEDVLELSKKGVNKVLVLGEKDFGANLGKVDVNSQEHLEWKWWCKRLFDTFKVVSFDNLALQQLKLKRFFTEDSWSTFYQGEHSFYINAVEGYFSPSSRNSSKTNWNKTTVQNYFKNLEK